MNPSVTTLQNKTPTLGQGQTTLAQGKILFGFTRSHKDCVQDCWTDNTDGGLAEPSKKMHLRRKFG